MNETCGKIHLKSNINLADKPAFCKLVYEECNVNEITVAGDKVINIFFMQIILYVFIMFQK